MRYNDGAVRRLHEFTSMTTGRPIRILVVAGARPNFVKIAPLFEQLKQPREAGRVETLLVHTGQHYDQALSHLLFEQMDIPRPDVNLEVGSGAHGKQTGEVMVRFEPVAMEWKPEVVVVVGDVNSTIACALVACKLGIGVAHVEAGLRSFDRTMPEEINRVLTDAISDLLFITEADAAKNLEREGIPQDKIYFVGNVMIDSLKKFLPIAQQSNALRDFHLLANSRTPAGKQARPFALLTLHRPSNVDEKEQLERMLGALNQVGKELPILFPAHPRTQERIKKFGLAKMVKTEWGSQERGVLLTGPIGYLEFLHLMSEATFVMTDSGGIQEETTVLGIPCLTLRENTERPVTVSEGTNILVGGDPERIPPAAQKILAGDVREGKTPALWDGRAAERIVSVLLKEIAPRPQAI